ncbi:GT2 family glycosyltransferase [Anaerobacterium chartisolvens]|uniref:GT2 family glycosyltransferase n=1 Tax=Anaerobacterium chartisolvens TaxID=1297424 RepID=A0A369B8E7_9FIRM|nr:glycosyltransferase [Anaerobacterium chartisolvens]RCX17585.1 GT2 family glycosyltransferase [Anaerobacterium chartisolvens]
MNKKKRFSFIIPTYQNKRLIKNTLQSLNRQNGYSKEDYEAVVIDDGSTDGTCEYIQGVNTNYSIEYIYLHRSSKSSRARARNAGISAAAGEIIVFIDGDMLIRENYLKELDRCFRASEDILVIGNRVMMTEEVSYEELTQEECFKGSKFEINSFENLEIRHIIFKHLSYNSCCYIHPWLQTFSCNMAVLKKHLDKNGGFDEGFKGWGIEDVELGYRLYKSGLRIIINNRIEAFHQCHSSDHNLKISPQKYANIELNALYFIEKHPEALDFSPKAILKMFKGKSLLSMDAVTGPRRRVSINYRQSKELPAVKSEILRLSCRKGLKIIVNDFVEEDELDVWVQLLGTTQSTPAYFPQSKKRELKMAMHTRTSLNMGSWFFMLKLKGELGQARRYCINITKGMRDGVWKKILK